jgi:GTP-binding protein
MHDAALLEKPSLMAVNKVDLKAAHRGARAVREYVEREGGPPVHAVSALTGKGVPALSEAIHQRLQQLDRATEDEPVVRTYRLAQAEVEHSIRRESDGFAVSGRDVERVLAMADLDSDEGVADLQRQLDRIGVLKELTRAGVKAGDTVRIGDFELEWT